MSIYQNRKFAWFLTVALLCGLLAALSFAAYQGQLGIDRDFMRWHQSFFEADIWIKAMEVVSFPGNGYNLAIAMVITSFTCLIFKKKAAASLVLSTGGVYLLNFVLKELIHRGRPLPTEVNVIGEAESDLGFPSGHVSGYTAFLGVVFVLATTYVKTIWLKRLLQAASLLLILLVGPSRMTLGMHWPSDVIGGYLLGSIFLLVALPAFFTSKAKNDA